MGETIQLTAADGVTISAYLAIPAGHSRVVLSLFKRFLVSMITFGKFVMDMPAMASRL
jgi:hypothetical protein